MKNYKSFLLSLNFGGYKITKLFNPHFNLAVGTKILNWDVGYSSFKQCGGEILQMAVEISSYGGACMTKKTGNTEFQTVWTVYCSFLEQYPLQIQ